MIGLCRSEAVTQQRKTANVPLLGRCSMLIRFRGQTAAFINRE